MTTVLPLLLALAATRLPTPSPAPTRGWPESTPRAEGLEPAPIEAFDADLASGKYGYVDSMLVIRRGKVVYEKAYDHSADYARLFLGRGAPGQGDGREGRDDERGVGMMPTHGPTSVNNISPINNRGNSG